MRGWRKIARVVLLVTVGALLFIAWRNDGDYRSDLTTGALVGLLILSVLDWRRRPD